MGYLPHKNWKVAPTLGQVSAVKWHLNFATYCCVVHYYTVYYLCITLLKFGCGYKCFSIYSKVTLVVPRFKIFKNAYSCPTYPYVHFTAKVSDQVSRNCRRPKEHDFTTFKPPTPTLPLKLLFHSRSEVALR